MSLPARIALATLLAFSLLPAASADDRGAAGRRLLPFASAEGLERLARTAGRSDFAALANQFEAQATIAFCGPTSAAIVLNALDPQGAEASHDRSRLTAADGRYLPQGLELTARRYTQEGVIARGPKTRAQVLGEPLAVNGQSRRDGGYQLRQLDALLRAHQVATRLVIVDEHVDAAAIRRDLIDNLGRPGDFVIVNYLRRAVGQTGGGHISPLAAYDAASDSVLVLDVNPSHQPWVWMPLATLIEGMRTRDAIENRGYILVQSR